MHRDEAARQLQRRMRATPEQPKEGALIGVAKNQLKPFIEKDPNTEHLRAFDCTVCKQRFVWDIREPLTVCPLCDAGAHQKANKLPAKRLTNSQRRKLQRMKYGKGTDTKGTGTHVRTDGTDSGESSEAQEPGSVRLPAA